MTLYRIPYGDANAPGGRAVLYAYNGRDSRDKLKEARGRHDPLIDHVIPQIQPIEFNLTKGGVLDLLRQETSPLNGG